MPYSFSKNRGVLMLLLFYSGLLPFVPLGESLLQFYLPRIINRCGCVLSLCACSCMQGRWCHFNTGRGTRLLRGPFKGTFGDKNLISWNCPHSFMGEISLKENTHFREMLKHKCFSNMYSPVDQLFNWYVISAVYTCTVGFSILLLCLMLREFTLKWWPLFISMISHS